MPPRVRILLDYRPALRQRTGVGEYVHELAAALSGALGAGERLVAVLELLEGPAAAGARAGRRSRRCPGPGPCPEFCLAPAGVAARSNGSPDRSTSPMSPIRC